MAKISDDDLHRVVALFAMVQRASQEGADDHVRNEGLNATSKLLQLLAKYGLDLGDVPALQQQHDQAEAAKAAKSASATATKSDSSQPNAPELLRHVLQSYTDMAPHEYIGATLWFLHTHVFDRFQISPRLALLSPVRNCGKSKVLQLADRLTLNAVTRQHYRGNDFSAD